MKPSALLTLSALLMITGGMVMDPLAGFACALLAGALALWPVLREKGRIRYIAAIMLALSILMAAAKAPDAISHYREYTSRSGR